jgi:hypothetical protein
VNAALRAFAHALANHVQLAFKSQIVFKIRSASNEDLPDKRLGSFGCGTEESIVNRNSTPTKYLLPFLNHNPLKELFTFQLGFSFSW